ncbi:glycosyltransferase [Cytophagaceae bacterium ABcell3]|nr:glycosyltransferase [Cytophagaceae bacterium ABcell3]
MNNKSIAFFGSSLISAYWNGAATYYRGILRALHNLGYDITFFEPDAYQRQEHRDIPDPEYSKVVVYKATEKAVFDMLQKASSADIVIKASGVGVFDELLEAEVLKLKTSKNKIIFWDVDAPATLDRIEKDPKDPFHEHIPQYDMVLTYGGGEPVIKAYTSHGAKKCIAVYNALDTNTHFPVKSDERFQADLAFLGNRLPDRESRVEEFFIKAACLCPHKEFIIGGSGWHDKPMPSNIKNIGHVYTKDHNAFNSTSKAVLNISRDSMARYGFSPATRVFEAAGAGACIISDQWEGIEFFFEPGKEILVANNGEEVAALLKDLSPNTAAKIGEAARKKVISAHTYPKRAEELHPVLQENIDQNVEV